MSSLDRIMRVIICFRKKEYSCDSKNWTLWA